MGIPIEDIKDWWAVRKPDTTQKSWDSYDKTHRATLAMVPHLLKINSLFEIGCGAGPNLRLLQKFYPDLRLSGSDINAKEIQFAADNLGIEMHNVSMPHLVGPEWEATLSCYALSYIPEDGLAETLGAILSKYLILIEPWGSRGRHSNMYSKKEVDVSPHWGHNYWDMTQRAGWSLIYRWPIEPVDHLDCLAIFERI